MDTIFEHDVSESPCLREVFVERLTGNSIILRNIAIFLETFDAVADAFGQAAAQLLAE